MDPSATTAVSKRERTARCAMLARRFVAMHQATRSARSRLFSPALAARHLLLTSATDISMINIHTAAVLRRHARVRVLCDVSAFRSVCRSSVISVACTHPVCVYTQPGVIGRSSRATSALCLLVFSHRELLAQQDRTSSLDSCLCVTELSIRPLQNYFLFCSRY